MSVVMNESPGRANGSRTTKAGSTSSLVAALDRGRSIMQRSSVLVITY